MSLYNETRTKPPKISVKSGANEVVLDLVSVMCDNMYRFCFKKREDGGFRLNTMGQAFSNFQINGYDQLDLEWMADEADWNGIVKAINSGTVCVLKAKSR